MSSHPETTRARAWVEDVVLPTYLVGEPNRNPMFLHKRVYQGSSGRVYPYPVIDRLSDRPVLETHRVVFLENRYLKVMVMPAFGGRVQYAYDKTNGYAFIYHNRVIKPALVGLAGPWLSGGIEFNWPQHHRPGTYCPVDYTITTQEDGRVTLWLGETEPMWHLKSTLALTLHPDRAILEIGIRLFNPTPLPQTFHLWTNPAVHVNDQYQSVFPPDVQAVYDHGKRDVSAFPIARGEYYKVDYAAGVDISWYKNLPVPTSYMAASSVYDFIGGYDHGRGAGMLHVADHHLVPGKKQWVWGSGDFGRAWDRNLTDEDGPYAELMCGVFADNQPDFSWLHPFETKEVTQYFLPYTRIGYVRNATIHAALALEIADGEAAFGAYVTSARPGAVLRLTSRGDRVWEQTLDLAPEQPVLAQARVPEGVRSEECRLELLDADGTSLVSYTPEPRRPDAIPDPAVAIPSPARVRTTEALYLAGLHLEQYRHATREPADYYREALRRDPMDARCNNALGRLLLRRDHVEAAEPYIRAAIASQNRHNANPYDGEPSYNLGLCLRDREQTDEAYAAFAKAGWNSAWQDVSWFMQARLRARGGHFAHALDLVDRAIARNQHNQKATHLRALLLRRLGRAADAIAATEAAIARDPLDFGAHNERLLAWRSRGEDARADQALDALRDLMRHDAHSHLELAADYAEAGAYREAIEILRRAQSDAPPPRAAGHIGPAGTPNSRPLLWYMSGFYALLDGDAVQADRDFAIAAQQSPDRCFPNSHDARRALETALARQPTDAHAAYYLGNLWYDKGDIDQARVCWERAVAADDAFPTAHRNLALAYFNGSRDQARALTHMQRAFALDPTDARVLFELDLLQARAQIPPSARLAALEASADLIPSRDDLLVEFITLLNTVGRHDEARRWLEQHTFHPWEGGEGKVTRQYEITLVELAKQRLQASDARAAIDLLRRARAYPPNLGEGVLRGASENRVLYWLGAAHAAAGDRDAARECWEEATHGMRQPAQAIYYNDADPESIFYQGLALASLDRPAAARERFETLAAFGRAHLRDEVEIDYFAVSLPDFQVFDDDVTRRNEINCRYLTALGDWGLERRDESLDELRHVLRLDPSHQAATLHLRDFASARPAGAGHAQRRTE